MTKTREQIEAEKAGKPRPDLIPARAIFGSGMVMGYGTRKHGNCTWRVAGTEQADPQTHLASLERHINEFKLDPDAREGGSGFPVLWHAMSQLAILIDLMENPPQSPHVNDGGGTLAWYTQRGGTVSLPMPTDASVSASEGGSVADCATHCDSSLEPASLPFKDWTLPNGWDWSIDSDGTWCARLEAQAVVWSQEQGVIYFTGAPASVVEMVERRNRATVTEAPP